MGKIPDHFNFGESKDMTVEELVIKLQRMYMDLSQAVNAKPDLVQRNDNGQPTDGFLAQGTININLATNKVEILTNHTGPSTVTWVTLS